jgi:3-hydroxybutyryl-CoA dehydrogenase
MAFLCKKLHMKVFVLANEELKQELLSQPLSDQLDIQWLDDIIDQPGKSADACIDLLFEHTPGRVHWLKKQAPLVVINAVTTPLNLIKEEFVRINGWNTFLGRNLVEAACNNDIIKEKATKLFELFGRTTEWVPDIAGFIAPRVVAAVINEAFLALEEQVSRENEIDTAMKLGTNYPYGPFEWGQKIGFNKVYALLEVLGNEESRYKPATLLKEKTLV